MKTRLIRIISMLCLAGTGSLAMAQASWYVNQQSGSNSNNGTAPSTPFKTVDFVMNQGILQPGDTLFFMGTFTNDSYDPAYSYGGNPNDSHLWTQENTIRINNLHGSPGQYISLKAFSDSCLLKGDGANILRIINASWLRIEGLEVAGEVENIPLSTATALQFVYKDASGSLNYRVTPGTPDSVVETLSLPALNDVSRPSYTDTRGIYMTNVHHIDILHNHIHHTPGTGLRVAECDYLRIVGNEVNDCSRKSYSGTHALVVTKATSMDTISGHKIFILRNKVHHNYNEIYSWAPTKTLITPKIDEGKGISLQRNDVSRGWTHGRFLVANNLTYWNGYSGIHSNTGVRMDFVNNSCYLNSYTGTVTLAGNNPGGNNIGISSSDGDDIRILNNIIVVDASFGGFAISSRNTTGLQVANNLIYGLYGTLSEDPDVVGLQQKVRIADPLFEDPQNLNFQLQATSPAIDSAILAVAPATDYAGILRDALPDLGAMEYQAPMHLGNQAFSEQAETHEFALLYPNPAQHTIQIQFQRKPSAFPMWKASDLSGKDVSQFIKQIELHDSSLTLDIRNLAPGSYFMYVNGTFYKFQKR